ncbi:MAG: SpoIIE family protein phosphatase [Cytophagaceae bacterium]|nr:SpoIIE family protein phosphatase [Cytophagaceae bacterium]MDW8457310.1 SpoIIE family protein phosphatase [Cytophagaceae bacterium]
MRKKLQIFILLFLAVSATLADRQEKSEDHNVKRLATQAKENEKKGDLAAAAYSYNELGHYMLSQKKYADAIKNYEKAESLYRNLKDRKNLVLSQHYIADVYEKINKPNKAIKLYETSATIAENLKDDALAEKSYEKLYQLYGAVGNKKKSDEYYALYKSFKTTRQNQQLQEQSRLNQQEIAMLKKKFSLSEKEIQQTQQELNRTTKELLSAKDSLSILEFINKQKEMQINLLNKEKTIKELALREKEAILKNKELALKEQKAIAEKEKIIIYFLSIGILMAMTLAFVIFRSYKEKQRAHAIIAAQNESITQQNINITNSINYAQRIQTAMLPQEKALHALIPDSFILFKPRDIVSGDFYWFYNVSTRHNLNEYAPDDDIGIEPLPNSSESDRIIVAAADCTGHGVPGALMSMIGYNLLNVIANKRIYDADVILRELHKSIRFALQQYKNDNQDGMDIALCVIDKKNKQLHFAGAKNPIIYIQEGTLHYIKGDKHPIGGSQGEVRRTYTKHTIALDKPTYVYLFSDGYIDQFGGPEKTKFMIKNFKEKLLQIHQLPFYQQKSILDKTIEDWKGQHEKQIDDILVLGLKVA